LGAYAQAQAPLQAFEQIEVVEVPETAAELFRKAERWFVDTFKDASEVIQLRDSVTHTLVGKGERVTYFVSGKGLNTVTGQPVFRYSMEVQTKEGRYRVKVYDATIDGGYFGPDTCCLGPCEPVGEHRGLEKRVAVILEDKRKAICPQAKAEVTALLASLKGAMLKPKDDW